MHEIRRLKLLRARRFACKLSVRLEYELLADQIESNPN